MTWVLHLYGMLQYICIRYKVWRFYLIWVYHPDPTNITYTTIWKTNIQQTEISVADYISRLLVFFVKVSWPCSHFCNITHATKTSRSQYQLHISMLNYTVFPIFVFFQKWVVQKVSGLGLIILARKSREKVIRDTIASSLIQNNLCAVRADSANWKPILYNKYHL